MPKQVQNKGDEAPIKIHNFDFFSKKYFSYILYFFSTLKEFIYFIWISDVKVMDNLVWGQSKHLLEKITCRIHFKMQFLQLKKNPRSLLCFLEQSHHWD